ncbi:MAG: NAD(P)H-hydrate dehydratase [Verrucomicrobiota bacterium]
MQQAEQELFGAGAKAEPLMDLAGAGCARSIKKLFPTPGYATVFCGKGNNAGDALVIGRLLFEAGWKVDTEFVFDDTERWSDLLQKKWNQFRSSVTPRSVPVGGPRISIDGLLGIGAKGPLRDPLANLAETMNSRRLHDHATTISIDIPSGIDGDSGEPFAGAVIADLTLSICQPKRGIVQESAINHVGRIEEIPLPQIPVRVGSTDALLISPHRFTELPPRRPFDFHKGRAGRVAIIAGSVGMAGAASLVAKGASHSGAGLVTVWVSPEVYPIVAALCPTEVMVRPYSSVSEITDSRTDSIAIGPGLGTQWDSQLVDFLQTSHTPMVIDADALNVMADLQIDPATLMAETIMTPHPGEFARLTGTADHDRFTAVRQYAEQWQTTLLLKGSRSLITAPGQPIAINTTGHPSMASGGMGDVLTGMIAGLVAQGIAPFEATAWASWLLGRSAELSAPTVTASTVADHLGDAILDWERSFCA